MKPGDFLLGVMDFFAILLPGSMATWLVMRNADGSVLKFLGMEQADRTAVWVLFLVCSYFLGHIVFMFGSLLDPLFDRWRKGKQRKTGDHTFQAAKALKDAVTGQLKDDAFSVLQWSRAFVQVHCPAARSEIDRLEADSKFFRGMVVIAALFTLQFLIVEHRVPVGLACLALVTPSYIRYRDQRWKMAELAFGTAVILGATRAAPARSPSAADGKAA